MSLDQLLTNTASFEPDHKNTKYVKISRVQKINSNIYRITTLTRIPAGVPGYPKGHMGRHLVVVEDLSGAGFVDSKTPVQVSCGCDRFKFKWEWALHRQGAAQIIHSNGAAAVVTNPRGIPCACKHIFLALLYLKLVCKRNGRVAKNKKSEDAPNKKS